jgi:hypothetical protein
MLFLIFSLLAEFPFNQKEKTASKAVFYNQTNNKKVLRIQGTHIPEGHKQDNHKTGEDTHKMAEGRLKHFLTIRQLNHPKMAAQSQ